ncbi:hypothetical protein K490DRAFT_74722 [Saccharata proteae CBS 121410]|uniref:Methyltransferase type 11 domain-containing protein n=1 Tax=Saccharata proteae CBS 121410 TaxID=1314787 RepID=A0A9P4LU59_9PEZI|nr:hypothetical protein K490DRAFT_74722 [Saccharata proteae CBS 121410]
MTSPAQASSNQVTDPTFRSYTAAQASDYHQARPQYPPELYAYIFHEHEKTGGKFSQLLDLGSGPGLATRDLAPAFDHAVGADPGVSMIDVAKQKGGSTKTGEPIRWEVCASEDSAKLCGEGEVDLLTGATTAHWWDMAGFWPQAAHLVKPGGTVALFSRCHYSIHPSTPNFEEMTRTIEAWREKYLLPHRVLGNELVGDFYENLGKPWESTPEAAAAFPESQFSSRIWNRNNQLDGPDGTDFFGGSMVLTEKQILAVLSTSSMVTRWREAHPDLAGTDEDVVKVLIRDFKGLGGADGIRTASGLVVLLFKRV